MFSSSSIFFHWLKDLTFVLQQKRNLLASSILIATYICEFLNDSNHICTQTHRKLLYELIYANLNVLVYYKHLHMWKCSLHMCKFLPFIFA